MDNENPSILPASDLPTRRPALHRSRSSSSVASIFDADGGGHSSVGEDDDSIDPIDAQEIYDLISTISDPEHPLTLGQLSVVNLSDITVADRPGAISSVRVEITPTITHCSLATLIGLGIKLRLQRCLAPRFRSTVVVKKNTHQSEDQVNKQLADKERVAAACENEQLMGVISGMLATCK